MNMYIYVHISCIHVYTHTMQWKYPQEPKQMLNMVTRACHGLIRGPCHSYGAKAMDANFITSKHFLYINNLRINL